MSQACGNCCSRSSLAEPLTDLHWSRLESLLRKNQAPSNIEQQTLAKVEQDIQEFDLEIARLQSAIVSLEYQRNAAKIYVSKYKSLVAPIRRLSNDVLVEIFMDICADITLYTYGSRLPPFHLCQVCKYWRSLVDDSPLLWSTLKVMLHPTEDEHFISDTTLLNLANLVLTKSGSCPLTIELADCNTEIHPVSALLLQHADRWLSASVSGCDQHISSISSFLQLKHLNISYGPGNIQITRVMPSLESLDIYLPVTPHLPLPNFPWNQLRRLTLDTPLLSHCAFVISQCIQLQRLTLKLDDRPLERGQEDFSVFIASQTITSLVLRCMQEEECKKFFALLQFPQLHVLELDDCHLPASSTYPSPFIAHSLSITSLSLVALTFSLEDLLALLRLLPTVTHFSFFQYSWKEKGTFEDFFSKLRPAYPSESRTLLPRLTHMEMEFLLFPGEADPATTAFVEVVKSRVAENRLKSVRFSLLNHCLNHDLISSLAYLPKVGIAISIQDGCGRIL